ncbi:MAG: NAD(P)-dependent oxidoreductase [Candidatus Micrarchaeota archaeon]
MKKFTVTITGATGRLGAVVVTVLEKKFNLRLLARNVKKAKQLFPGKKVIEIDLENASVAQVKKAVKGSWVVVHLAGLVDVCASRQRLFSVNYEATRKLVKACEREKVPFFVHCSSIAVYGDSTNKISENTLLRPTSVYGQSKLAAETVVKHSNLHWVMLRPGIIYGSHFTGGFFHVLEQMKRGSGQLIGKGDNFVPLVYEGDVANAFLKTLQLLRCGNKLSNQAFNIVSENEPSQREALQALAKTFSLAVPSRSIPLRFAVGLAKLHSLYCSLRGRKNSFPAEYVYMLGKSRLYDTSKAKKMLKFTASTSLEKGLLEVKKSWG